MRIPPAFAVLLLAACWLAPNGAHAEDCLKTYNKKGEVVGKYCGEGLVEPSPGGARTAESAPAIHDPGPAPDPAGSHGKARAKRAPRGIEIRCTAAQKAAGQRCTGVFDLSL